MNGDPVSSTLPSLDLESKSYWAGEEMTILELTEEVCNEEAAKHQAHRQQGSVGVWPLYLQLMNSYIAVWMNLDMLVDDWVEGVFQCVVQMVIVQDQRVGFEDLSKKTYKRQHE